MGWSSATEVFDRNVGVILDASKELSNETTKTLIKVLIISLQDKDWDCESESMYWSHPLIRECFKETDPDWDWDDIDEYDPVEVNNGENDR